MSADFTKYRKDIDGLRAIAIIAVVLFHLKPSLLLGGFVGVDIFFVISGFLITQILLREMQEKRFSFVGFYIRRVRRIFPALFVVMFCSLLVAVFILGGDELFWFAKVFRYSSIQISNFLFQENVGYFDPKFENTPLLHTWSLTVEEQFYVLLPLILFFSFKLKKTRNFILGLD